MKYCPHCGLHLYCPHCGAAGQSGAYCSECGEDLTTMIALPPSLREPPHEKLDQMLAAKATTPPPATKPNGVNGARANRRGPKFKSDGGRQISGSALLSPHVLRWVEEEARRSEMSVGIYLRGLIEDHIDDPLQSIDPSGYDEEIPFFLNERDKKQLKERCKKAKISMASAIRGMVKAAMQEAKEARG